MAKKKEAVVIEPIQPINGYVVVIFEKSNICKAGTEKTMSVEHAEILFKKGVIRYK